MQAKSSFTLDQQGISTSALQYWNLGTAPLVEAALTNGEGILAKDGPLVVKTGKHTGRSASDKFIAKDSETESTVWWGKTNVPMTPENFAECVFLRVRVKAFHLCLTKLSDARVRLSAMLAMCFRHGLDTLSTLIAPVNFSVMRLEGLAGRLSFRRKP